MDKDAAEKTMLDNRGAYTLAPPLKGDYEHEPKPKRQLLDRAAEAVGPPRFEELCKARKGKRPEKYSRDRKIRATTLPKSFSNCSET